MVLANNSRYWSNLTRKDGYVTCAITATRYKDVATVEPFALPSYTLEWKRPVLLELPLGITNFSAQVALFDGTEVRVDGSKVEKYFEASLLGQQLTIAPIVPEFLD